MPSPGAPPKTELEICVEAPLGDIDRDSAVAEVEAKRDETDALGFRYGRLAVEDANDCGSVWGRVTRGLRVGVLDDPGGSNGESLCGGVMESGEFSGKLKQGACFYRSPAVSICSTMRLVLNCR